LSREAIPFAAADISALARSLRGQLMTRKALPSHVEMLNMLARATGHRNFQHLRAQGGAAAAAPTPATREPAPPAEPMDLATVSRVAGHFDSAGRMVRWPGKTRHQELGLWVLWARLPARRTLSEGEVNAAINAGHLFGDHAILRRSLCNAGLLARTPDGREYRRVERPPTAEAAALIARVKAQAG
jgi:hypothetical protein